MADVYNRQTVGARELPISAKTWLGLVTILALAAGLRLWGIGAGAPSRMGVDEPVVLQTTLRILQSGNLNPHFFDYGGLTFYLHTAVSAAAFLGGASSGRYSSVQQLWIGDLLVPTRMMTALLGVATVLVVFCAGRRWGTATALTAALGMAVLPSHVRESHFTLSDTPLTLAVSLVLLTSMRAAETTRLASMVIAGAMVGLAGGIKYNGAIAGVMPLVAALAFPQGQRLVALGTAALAAAATFLIVAPYTVLDLPGFLNGFGAVLGYYSGARTMGDAASIYLSHLRNWFSWPGVVSLLWGYVGLAVAGVGAIRLLTSPDKATWRWAGAIALAFMSAQFWLVANQGSLVYGRYLLPLAPMLMLAAAAGVVGIGDRLARSSPRLTNLGLPLVVIVIFAAPVGTAVTWSRDHARPSTLDQVGRWLTRLAPTEIAVMEGAHVQAPPRVQLRRVAQIVDQTLEAYQAAGVTYLVTSSEVTDAYRIAPVGRERQVAALAELRARTDVVQTFAPNESRTGPTIVVLRVPPRAQAPSPSDAPRQ
jgi:4-amino-4-deoxy-L-arabinose transferase-like glycosyltransferase